MTYRQLGPGSSRGAAVLSALLLAACGGNAREDDAPGGGDGGQQAASGGVDTGGDGGAATGGAGAGSPGGSGGLGATGGGDGSATGGGDGSGTGGVIDATGGAPSQTDGPLLGYIIAGVSLGDGLSSYLSIVFSRESNVFGSGEPSEECPGTQVGDCVIADCWTPSRTPAEGTDVRLHAGKIEFSIDNGMSFEVSPEGADNSYMVITGEEFGGGEEISFSAEGGTVEAFSGQIDLPLAPMLLQPHVSGGGSSVVTVGVAAAQDLDLVWDVRNASEWVVFQARGDSSEPYFNCTFDASSGGGTIPSEVLQHVGAGTEFSGVGLNLLQIPVEDGRVDVYAQFDLVNESRTATPHFVIQ